MRWPDGFMECKLKSVYTLRDVMEQGLSIPFADPDKPENIPIDSVALPFGTARTALRIKKGFILKI